MINAVKLYFPNGEERETLVVGEKNIKQMFFNYNKETKTESDTLVVLCDDNILEYRGFVFVVQKDYKEQK